MGAQAETALAVVVVPQGLDAQVEEDVFQMMAGALPVLQAAGCALVGGHTSEGAELSLGPIWLGHSMLAETCNAQCCCCGTFVTSLRQLLLLPLEEGGQAAA